ncbi:hypothetical protein KFE25_009217 [Diacronema lutheri]|uniref:N-acetyltransferase domain-containing protein n=1 Tax=Diacronema lutheri TaxID=2081491 RepID=A0A8J6CH50_DIALT|nr:hypothetical protein KFE25_009217 [Diacronema lutheri]
MARASALWAVGMLAYARAPVGAAAAVAVAMRRLGAASCATSMAAPTGGVTLEVTTAYGAIKEAADFFAREFWASAGELSDAQRGTLADQHRADFERRYGELTGKRRFPSALILALDGERIVGCAGVEMTVVDAAAGRFWDRPQAEALFSERFAAMGGRERSQYRKANLDELAAAFLQGTGAVRPVLSNLAVRRESRGTGLGERLVRGCEELVRTADGWAGDDLWLLVDEQNAPAVALYMRLGFEEVWRSEEMATRLVRAAGGGLEVGQEPSFLLAMAKKL